MLKSDAGYEKNERDRSEERRKRPESECLDSDLSERQGANLYCDTIDNIITAMNKKIDMLSDVVYELSKNFDMLRGMVYATAAVPKFATISRRDCRQ